MNFIRSGDMFIRVDKIQAIERLWEDESLVYLDKKLKIQVDTSAENLIEMIDKLEKENEQTG